MKNIRKRHKGYFLLVAMILILIMGSVGAVMMQSFVNVGNSTYQLYSGMQTLYAAEAGMQVALRQLLRTDSANRDTCDVLSGDADSIEYNFSATAALSSLTTTTLSAAITAAATTIPVASTAGFAASGLLVIDNEYMTYGAISGNNFVGVVRGTQGTTPTAFATGRSITQHQCAISSTGGLPSVASPTYQASVNQYLNVAYAYVANSNNNSVSICPLFANNGLNTCVKYTNSTFDQPFQVIINPAATKAYVMNNGSNKISLCSLNANGTFASCSSLSDSSFNFSYSGGYINAANTYLYVANFSTNKVSICPITSSGTLSTCTTSTGSSTFKGPNNISLSTTNAYIFNSSNNTVSICPISGSTFGTCTSSTASSTLNVSGNGDINPAYSTLYIANSGNNTISVCPVNTNGSLGTCTTSTGNSTFKFNSSFTSNIFVSAAGYLYVSNSGNSTISICPLNSNGSIGTCTADSDSTFSTNEGVWLSYGKIY